MSRITFKKPVAHTKSPCRVPQQFLGGPSRANNAPQFYDLKAQRKRFPLDGVLAEISDATKNHVLPLLQAVVTPDNPMCGVSCWIEVFRHAKHPPHAIIVLLVICRSNQQQQQIPQSVQYPKDGPLTYLIEGGTLKGLAQHVNSNENNRFMTL